MKRFAIFVALAIALLTGRSATAQSDWQWYQSVNGFQYAYPNDWRAQPIPASTTTIFGHFGSADAGGYAFGQFLAFPSPPDPMNQLQGELSDDSTDPKKLNFTASGPQAISVTGASSAAQDRTTYRSVSSGTDWISERLAAQAGNNFYGLTLNFTAAYDARHPGLMDAILQTFSVTQAAPASVTNNPSIAPPPATAGPFAQFSGSGDRQSATFTISSAQQQVCWTVSGRSPTGSLGPSVGIFIESSGGSFDYTSFDVHSAEQNCSYAHLKPGSYYLKVIATSWSNYSITVSAA